MSNSTSTNTVILKDTTNWKKWFEDLRSGIEREIWEVVNPHGPLVEELPRPQKPTFRQYNPYAHTFADLSGVQKKDYETARRFYDSDIKEYTTQQSKLAALCEKI